VAKSKRIFASRLGLYTQEGNLKKKTTVYIEIQGADFVLVDASGTVYGRYDREDIAQEACDGWNQYYQEENHA
jgi:hypothetical protein